MAKKPVRSILKDTKAMGSKAPNAKELLDAVAPTLSSTATTRKAVFAAVDRLKPDLWERVKEAPTSAVAGLIRAGMGAAGSKAANKRHQRQASEVSGLVDVLNKAAAFCRPRYLVNGRWGFGASTKIERKAEELWLQKEGATPEFFISKVTLHMVRAAMKRAKKTT